MADDLDNNQPSGTKLIYALIFIGFAVIGWRQWPRLTRAVKRLFNA